MLEGEWYAFHLPAGINDAVKYGHSGMFIEIIITGVKSYIAMSDLM